MSDGVNASLAVYRAAAQGDALAEFSPECIVVGHSESLQNLNSNAVTIETHGKAKAAFSGARLCQNRRRLDRRRSPSQASGMIDARGTLALRWKARRSQQTWRLQEFQQQLKSLLAVEGAHAGIGGGKAGNPFGRLSLIA